MDEKRFEQLEKDIVEIKDGLKAIKKSLKWDINPSLLIIGFGLMAIGYMIYDMWEVWDKVVKFFN